MRLPEAVLGVTVTGESPSGHDGYDSVFGFTDKDMCYCQIQLPCALCHGRKTQLRKSSWIA